MPTRDVRRRAALLLLSDGRLPAGGYAHSGGLEPTVAAGHVSHVADLGPFLSGRLRTTGLVSATFAAAACRSTLAGSPAPEPVLSALDAELDARTPSPAQRETSRQLGRQLVRALSSITPQADLGHLGRHPHQPIVLGVAFGALGLGPSEVALSCLHEIAAGPVAAAVRLLSTDPFATHQTLATLGPLIDDLAAEAVERSLDATDLPADAAPLLDTNAERHLARSNRLFAS